MGASSLEGYRVKKYFLIFSIISIIFMGCASSIMHFEKSEDIQKNDEFDKAVRIETVGSEIAPVKSVENAKESTTSTKVDVVNKKQNLKVTKPAKAGSIDKKVQSLGKTEKDISIEDTVGFEGRRPIKDPYRIGEVVTHNVHYFKVSAGEIKFAVENFANVNGHKSYSFATELKTSSLFETFYAVDDRAVTQLGFDNLVPSSFQLHVKESGQLRESRAFFDWDKNRAFFWEKKVTTKNGEEIKKIDWELLPFSQNVFSAIFYMRVFQWENDKEYSFRVAHDNENLVFKAKVIRRETLNTDAGAFKAIVIKPEFTVRGLFKPVGDIYIWLSDDDRKYVLRIESKIKIGTIISEVTKIEPGR